MIENENQYRVTQAQAKMFEEALANFSTNSVKKGKNSEILEKIQKEALASQLATLREELADYEASRVAPEQTNHD